MEADPIIQNATNLLTAYLSEHEPQREKWIFIVHHSLRVEGLVRQILEGEAPIPEKSALTLRAAAILHDIGSLEDRPTHAEAGARIVRQILEKDGLSLANAIDPGELCALIRAHSRGKSVEASGSLAILRDADALDQVGAMSILAQAANGAYSHPGFYNDLYIQLNIDVVDECDAILPRLYTQTGITILEQKREFIAGFIRQLEEEIGPARSFDTQFL